MTRRLRGLCRVCKYDVATKWKDAERVAVAHQVAGRGHALCRGSDRPAVLPLGMLR